MVGETVTLDRDGVREGFLSLLSSLPKLISGSEKIFKLSDRELEIKRLIDNSFLREWKTGDKQGQESRFEICKPLRNKFLNISNFRVCYLKNNLFFKTIKYVYVSTEAIFFFSLGTSSFPARHEVYRTTKVTPLTLLDDYKEPRV